MLNRAKQKIEEQIINLTEVVKNKPLMQDRLDVLRVRKSEFDTYKEAIAKVLDALNEVNEAFDFAETQPWPNPEDALEEVYVNYPKELLRWEN